LKLIVSQLLLVNESASLQRARRLRDKFLTRACAYECLLFPRLVTRSRLHFFSSLMFCVSTFISAWFCRYHRLLLQHNYSLLVSTRQCSFGSLVVCSLMQSQIHNRDNNNNITLCPLLFRKTIP
jgi:hypothetical protein